MPQDFPDNRVLRNLAVRHLHCIAEVYRSRSAVLAAQQLNISPSAVS